MNVVDKVIKLYCETLNINEYKIIDVPSFGKVISYNDENNIVAILNVPIKYFLGKRKIDYTHVLWVEELINNSNARDFFDFYKVFLKFSEEKIITHAKRFQQTIELYNNLNKKLARAKNGYPKNEDNIIKNLKLLQEIMAFYSFAPLIHQTCEDIDLRKLYKKWKGIPHKVVLFKINAAKDIYIASEYKGEKNISYLAESIISPKYIVKDGVGYIDSDILMYHTNDDNALREELNRFVLQTLKMKDSVVWYLVVDVFSKTLKEKKELTRALVNALNNKYDNQEWKPIKTYNPHECEGNASRVAYGCFNENSKEYAYLVDDSIDLNVGDYAEVIVNYLVKVIKITRIVSIDDYDEEAYPSHSLKAILGKIIFN